MKLIYVVTELMQSDLHKIIVSPQPLSSDHAKVFLYQILRGLKYLHSACILHRDIKPGNLLVNSNCVLKICDFGLARVEETDESRHMTQEVVTQYYRAPEILMGSRHYSNSIDIWSVGCIFAELLGRRILFQAQSPIQQLDLITDLLGTPSMEAMRTACEGARAHILRGPNKQPSLPVFYTLSSQVTHEAVHLLCRMLVFDPSKRISAKDALAHPYLDEGRLRYHTCMCKCCYTTSSGRIYTSDFEPVTNPKFDDGFEKNLSSVRQVKDIIHQFILEQQKGSRVPLCINPQSAAFKSFISADFFCAHGLLVDVMKGRVVDTLSFSSVACVHNEATYGGLSSSLSDGTKYQLLLATFQESASLFSRGPNQVDTTDHPGPKEVSSPTKAPRPVPRGGALAPDHSLQTHGQLSGVHIGLISNCINDS
ncbi:serine/threonine-protein kinase NLK isoform X13 [Syngnathoides biaculeatus]|uniref:serine/threonine-protein kinase NLK isoform X13 n=1 Tax=Syngnathoides biaculeatus TaxID=300417 RepID=UPI002ADE037F|nr:serine/threonine-protein kinase NLK isoform X13 [Syngnathoides biaculeatus]XP_061683598.1 serine/threonine-protein kinase NLK isoform X13 [Syngnathoides biaculeatus]XP_061683599.1 serine/threonine-protein kinase NLK isoform X13 [Syngnathoides biaculeatus]